MKKSEYTLLVGIAMSVFTMGIFLGWGFALAIGAGLVAGLPKEGTFHVPILGNIYHWQKLFLLIGFSGLAISLLMLTVKEPARKDVMQKEGVRQTLSLNEALKIVLNIRKPI